MLKKIFTISLKKAILALGASGGSISAFHNHVNFHSWHGILLLAQAVGITIGVSEFWYWWPKIQSWASKDDGTLPLGTQKP